MDTLVQNVFGTNFPRTILLSYVVEGFLALIDGAPVPRNHAAYAEAIQIAHVCKDYGYNVDVCQFTYEGPIEYTRYDVIFGIGKPLSNAFYQNARFIKTVFYGTGTAQTLHNAASAKKAKACYDEHGVWLLNASRLVIDAHPAYSFMVTAIVSDAPNTYTESTCPVYPMRMHCNAALPEEVLADKDYNAAQSHFLYFSGGGSLHKGLDLALKAFAQRPDLTLHVCDGPVLQFYEAFKEYFALPNIQFHGFLDVASADFQELMKVCGFTLCPSCSEGQPTAILNTSCNGLVAILSDGARPNAADDLAIRFSSLSVDGLLQAIDQAASLSTATLRDLSLATMARIREYHSMDAFDANMRRALGAIFALPVNPPPHPVSFTPAMRSARLLTLCVVSGADVLYPLRDQLTAHFSAVSHTLIGVSTASVEPFHEVDAGIYHLGITGESSAWTLFDNVLSSLGDQWQAFDGLLLIEGGTIAVHDMASEIAPLLHPMSHTNKVVHASNWLFMPPQVYVTKGKFGQTHIWGFAD